MDNVIWRSDLSASERGEERADVYAHQVEPQDWRQADAKDVSIVDWMHTCYK